MMLTPLKAAALVDADRKLCAEYLPVSMPERDSTFFSQLAIVSELAGENGLLVIMKMWSDEDFSPLAFRYLSMHFTGHNDLSEGYAL